jgi:hypothetical protein
VRTRVVELYFLRLQANCLGFNATDQARLDTKNFQVRHRSKERFKRVSKTPLAPPCDDVSGVHVDIGR